MDFQKKVASMCGCPIELATKPRYPVKRLQEVSSQNFEPTTANLSTTPVAPPRTMTLSCDVPPSMKRNNEVTAHQNRSMNGHNAYDKTISQQMNSNVIQEVTGPATCEQVRKVIPMFRQSIYNVERVNQEKNGSVKSMINTRTPIAPTFKPAKRSAISDTLQRAQKNHATVKHSAIQSSTQFSTSATPQQSTLVNRASLSMTNSTKSFPSFQRNKLNSDSHTSLVQAPHRVVPSFHRMSNDRPQARPPLVQALNRVAPSFHKISNDRLQARPPPLQTPNVSSSNAAKSNREVISSKTVKRKKLQVGDNSPAPKKPREKPKLQENVDIQKLALENKLSKVNALTLTVWLKQKGVVVKSKDKKVDLITKAINYIKTKEE
ncbi:uncharacterized protein [Antedon mediterranea]|uniref:uncharacterized protein n=1 Tax=Antedon mediterranea TaxID=105859 RepID=UPI003AF8E363